jgi:DNA uptake protein ComE-like DNA-binding protein
MRHPFALGTITIGSLLLAAGGCASDPDVETVGAARAAIVGGACGLGDEVVATDQLTPASIPSLSAVQRAQIVLAVQESAHTDVTTVEEAFDRVDENEINVITWRHGGTNQFYVEIEYGAGENSYGAVFYWGTDVKGAAIHDGFPEECGPLTFNYDRGDTAPACGGFLTYANTASFGALDAYLPSNVAQAIVDARAANPFDSVASVMAVNGVAEFRLQQLLSAARAAGLVGASCSGIYDQIATSADEASAMVGFVNQASEEELRGVLAPLIDESVVNALVFNRPFATAGAISGTSRVGPATFRLLRNAATFRRPFEELVDEVNEINHPDAQVRLDQHFDWRPFVAEPGDGLSGMECFGIDPALLPPGATNRPFLADGGEVLENVSQAVASANAFGELDVDPAPGLADLEFRGAGSSFFGCYVTYHPNPWQYDYQTFFVDTENGASVLITFHYVE